MIGNDLAIKICGSGIAEHGHIRRWSNYRPCNVIVAVAAQIEFLGLDKVSTAIELRSHVDQNASIFTTCRGSCGEAIASTVELHTEIRSHDVESDSDACQLPVVGSRTVGDAV